MASNPKDKPAQRKCLACGRLFNSSGIGNRRCARCRKRLRGMEDPNPDPISLASILKENFDVL